MDPRVPFPSQREIASTPPHPQIEIDIPDYDVRENDARGDQQI